MVVKTSVWVLDSIRYGFKPQLPRSRCYWSPMSLILSPSRILAELNGHCQYLTSGPCSVSHFSVSGLFFKMVAAHSRPLIETGELMPARWPSANEMFTPSSALVSAHLPGNRGLSFSIAFTGHFPHSISLCLVYLFFLSQEQSHLPFIFSHRVTSLLFPCLDLCPQSPGTLSFSSSLKWLLKGFLSTKVKHIYKVFWYHVII